MSSKDDIKLFISEAEDLIQKTEDEILKLEENPNDLKPIQELFFTFHALKGLTAMAGFDNLSKFCHHFESFLENTKDKKESKIKRENSTYQMGKISKRKSNRRTDKKMVE